MLIGLELSPSKGLMDFLTAGMVGKLSSDFLSSMVAAQLLKEFKVMVIFTLNNPNVIRLEPPLTVTTEEIDYVVEALDTLFSGHKSFIKIALKSGKSAISSFFRR